MSVSETTPLLNEQHVQQEVNRVEQRVQEAAPDQSTQFQLARAYGALKAGKLPSQKQITNLLVLLRDSSILQTGTFERTGRFSDDGVRLIQDIKATIDSLVKIGNSKNSDDKIQQFIHHCSNAVLDVDVPSNLETTVTSLEARKDTEKATESLKVLGNLLITSNEFRNLISDSVLFARDIFADAASSVADKAKEAAQKSRPSEEERQQGVNIKKSKRKAKQLKKDFDHGKLNVQIEEGKTQVRQWVDEAIPEAERAKEEFISRLKAIVVEAQSNEQYHRSIDTIINLIKKYAHKAEHALEEAADKTNLNENKHADEALSILREVIESFSGKSLDDLIQISQKIIKEIRNDPKLHKFFQELEEFIQRALHDEGYIVSRQASARADQLYDQAQRFLQDNADWKRDSREFMKQLSQYQIAFTGDRLTTELLDNLEHLSEDLSDLTGRGFSFIKGNAPSLYSDLVKVVLPRVLSTIKEIPLPRLEYKSEALDLVIDDLKLESASFIPDLVKIQNHNELILEQGYAAYAASFDSSLRLKVTGLRLSASDISYYINKKSGNWFTRWEDSGLLSIDMSHGKGLCFDIELESADEEDAESFFRVKNVNVNLDHLSYSVSQSQHFLLNFLLRPFIRPQFHSAIETALKGQIENALSSADLDLFALRERARAASNASPTISGYFRALFAAGGGPSYFSGGKTTSKGVIKTGLHGEYILAVGIDEQILPGKGGPEGYQDRKRLINAATNAYENIPRVQDALTQKAYDLKGKGKDLDRAALKSQRAEECRNGWQSSAFNA